MRINGPKLAWKSHHVTEESPLMVIDNTCFRVSSKKFYDKSGRLLDITFGNTKILQAVGSSSFELLIKDFKIVLFLCNAQILVSEILCKEVITIDSPFPSSSKLTPNFEIKQLYVKTYQATKHLVIFTVSQNSIAEFCIYRLSIESSQQIDTVYHCYERFSLDHLTVEINGEDIHFIGSGWEYSEQTVSKFYLFFSFQVSLRNPPEFPEISENSINVAIPPRIAFEDLVRVSYNKVIVSLDYMGYRYTYFVRLSKKGSQLKSYRSNIDKFSPIGQLDDKIILYDRNTKQFCLKYIGGEAKEQISYLVVYQEFDFVNDFKFFEGSVE